VSLFKVYYDTPNDRPFRHFATDADAIEWAKARMEKNPTVVEVTEKVIWTHIEAPSEPEYEMWSAREIGASGGAYSGKVVEFEILGKPVRGILERSDRSMDGPRSFLWINGANVTLPDATPVKVFK